MFPQQYDQFMTTLCFHFGRNQYFKRRLGEILISPEEQEVIRQMLEKVGADSKMELDNYEVLKTEDIHPPKTGISVHFSGSLV